MENNFDSGTVFQVRAQNRHDPVVNGNYFGLSVGLYKTEQEAQERVDSLKGEYDHVWHQPVHPEN